MHLTPEAQGGLALTLSAGSFISIPLLIWVLVIQHKAEKRVRRIERFLMSQAHRHQLDYLPDEETLAEVRKLMVLREKRLDELREMEKSDDRASPT